MQENIFANMEMLFKLEKIPEAAKRIISLTRQYKVFAVHGEMGAGKTTLIQAVCKAMGVEGNTSSPTFAIINQYATKGGQIIYHLDLYRLKDEEEALSSGVEDCLWSGNTCFAEWPERALKVFPEDTLHLFITAIDTDTRKLVIENV